MSFSTKVLLSDGSYGIVEAVKPIHYDKAQTTYNFEVADVHTYYVGNGVLVHNMNGADCGGKVKNAVEESKDFLGKDAKMITNQSGDKIFISKDGKCKIRFDINNPAPHEYPHAHVEVKSLSRWKKSGPLWPKDLPHK